MSRATVSQAGAARTASGLDERPGDGLRGPAVEDVRELRHEVGNALTAAAAYAQWLLLQRSPGPDEREYRALQAIRDSVARAIRILERSERPRQPAFRSLQDLVGLAVDQMPSARHCDVQIRRLTQERAVVSVDPDAVIQILTNLLSNAAKYSPPGTPIEVELNRVDGKGLVTVRDWGIGFEPELKDTIFDGYRSTRARQMADGQGIGLRLSRRLAKDAGGCLWGTSSPDHGTAFHFELPLSLPVPLRNPPTPCQGPDEPLASWGASPPTSRPAAVVARSLPADASATPGRGFQTEARLHTLRRG